MFVTPLNTGAPPNAGTCVFGWLNIPLLTELDEVVEVPKTEFVCKPVDELLVPNKLAAVVVAPPNREVFACEVIGLLNSEAEDALPS